VIIIIPTVGLVKGCHPFADRAEGVAAIREGHVDAVQAKPNRIGVTIAIHVAECTNMIFNLPTVSLVKGGDPLADRTEGVATIREGYVDTV